MKKTITDRRLIAKVLFEKSEFEEMFKKIEEIFGKIIEITFAEYLDYESKFGHKTDNTWIVMKTNKGYCLVVFEGAYYGSVDTRFDVYVSYCENLDYDMECYPMPHSKNPDTKLLEEELGVFLKDILDEYEFEEIDLIDFVDELQKSDEIYKYSEGYIDFKKYTPEEQNKIKEVFKLIGATLY